MPSSEALDGVYEQLVRNLFSGLIENSASDHRLNEKSLGDFVAVMIAPLGRGRRITASVRPSLIRVKNTINKYSKGRICRLMRDAFFAPIFGELYRTGRMAQLI